MTPEARAWKVLLTEYEDKEQAVHIFAEQIRAAIAEERESCAKDCREACDICEGSGVDGADDDITVCSACSPFVEAILARGE